MKEDKGKTPLRIILHNFLNHIEKLEAHRSPDDSYEKEFQDLKLFSETLKGLKQYSSGEGEKEVNRKKNRYKDILPFDFSRVILSEYAGTPGSDYINANYIKGASGSPAYIASQGPLPHTVNDFWRMVVECEVHVIIMACNQDEAGKHKCENYWVAREGEVKQFGMVKIRLIQGSTVCPDFSVRTMRLQYTNRDSNPEERTVCQFHYSAWPDHGVPPSVRPLLDMVRLVRDTQASETLPVLVHCSAGCGRTGTICAIDYVWGLLRAGKLTKDFSLLALVREMRRQRVAMVQTTEQYVLVHRAVRELFHEQLRVIDSHPYENIDLNGSLRTSPELQNSCPETEEITNEAPPLPRKNRPHIASSKYEKEVENQTQKERNSQSKQSSPGRPRIAKLKAMFERSPISRSQSLGRQAAINNAMVTKSPPVIPIKRSKSLRILGYGERSKLSIAPAAKTSTDIVDGEPKKPDPKRSPPSDKTGRQVRRRRSFEWNGTSQPARRSLHLEDRSARPEVLGAVSIRERRDSFRQAVSQDAAEARRERERIAAELRARLSNPPARPMTPRRGPAKPPPPNPNVIVVKADRSSPKAADLYVKSLPSVPPTRSYHSLEREVPATASTSKTPLKKTNSSDNDLYARIGQMRRALTSLDLKSAKHLDPLPDPIKLRLPLQPETPNRNSIKVYESLEKMIRRDVDPRRPAATPGSSKDKRPNSPQKDFYSSPRGGPSPQTASPRGGPSPQTEQYSSPRGGPSPQTDLYSSPKKGPSPQTDLYSSPKGGPSPQTDLYSSAKGSPSSQTDLYSSPKGGTSQQADLYSSARGGPSSQTDLYSSPRGGPSPQIDHYSSPRGAPSPQTDLYSSPKGVPSERNDRTVVMYKESDGTSYGLAAGVSMRRAAQDDLALCAGIPMPPGPVAPPRVKRHASVVLLRHTATPGVTEHSRGPATTPRRSEPKTTSYLKGPFNIDVDEIADNMRKYSASSPRTPVAHNPRPGASIHHGRPPNAGSPAGPPPQGFQLEGHRLQKGPKTQAQPHSHSQSSHQANSHAHQQSHSLQPAHSHQQANSHPQSNSLPHKQSSSHPHQQSHSLQQANSHPQSNSLPHQQSHSLQPSHSHKQANSHPQSNSLPHQHQMSQAMSSNQQPHLSSLPTQHKHQAPPQCYMSPQPNQQRFLLSQQNSPRPFGPHMHPQWQQLKPPKQLYVQQPRSKGLHRQTHPSHVHPSPPRPHHVHSPPYTNPQSVHPQSPPQPHQGGHQTHPMRGATSQSFASSLYQSAAQLRDDTVKTPVKKQQYL